MQHTQGAIERYNERMGEEELMDVASAAALLDVSKPTVYRMIREKRIQAIERPRRKRNRFMVLREDVQRILDQERASVDALLHPDAPPQ